VSRRLLVKSGGGSFSFPAVPNITLVSIANAGALLGQNFPNAVYYNGVTYFGYDNGDNGNIEVRTYTHATGVTSAATVVEAAWEKETHDPPALLMRASDHRLMVFYMKHSGTVARLKVATNPESIAAFGAATNLAASIGASDYTYPSPHQLTGLANQPIYLFFRDGNTAGTPGTEAWLTYTVSLDDGATWSTKNYVHKPTTARPYWMVRSNSLDRIDVFIGQDERQAVDNVPGAHMYFDGTTWRGTNGTPLSGASPWAFSAFTQVNDGSTGSVDPQDIVYGHDGKPMVTWRHWTNPVANRVIHSYFARWDGSTWTSYLVQTDSDEWFITDVYPTIVGWGRKLTSGTFLGGNQIYDVWRYTSSDNGLSWGKKAITSGTSDQIWYLTRVLNYGSGLRALWAEGTFTDATHFDFGILGAP